MADNSNPDILSYTFFCGFWLHCASKYDIIQPMGEIGRDLGFGCYWHLSKNEK